MRADFEAVASEAEAATKALSNVTACELAEAVLHTASSNPDRSVSAERVESLESSDVNGNSDQIFGQGQLAVSP